jgi:hypothetical protein
VPINLSVANDDVRWPEAPYCQWRSQEFEIGGGQHGERRARAYKGVWGRSPQRGPGAEPLVRVRGAKPPEAGENFYSN